MAIDSYIFGGDSGLSYEELQRRRAIATALSSQQRKMPQTFGEGLAYLGQSFGDALAERGLMQMEKAQRERDARAFDAPATPATTQAPPSAAPSAQVPYRDITTKPNAEPNISADMLQAPAPAGSPAARVAGGFDALKPQMAGGAPTPTGADLAPPVTPSDIVMRRQNAISGIETGGAKNPYQTLGAVTQTGDRAYGRYGVMGANIPEWTQAALGRPMTAQEFLASDKAQDAVFNHRFGQYADKYGEEGAAKAWYAGEKGMQNPNATDMHGRLNVQGYGQDYLRRLNPAAQAGAGAPQAAGPPQGADPRARLAATLAGGGAPIQLAAAPTGTMTDAGPPGAGNPPTPTDIQPAPMRAPSTQVAQNAVPSFAMPGSVAPWQGGAPAAAPAGAPASPRPLDPGVEPAKPGPTDEMIRYRRVAGDPAYSTTTRAEARERFQQAERRQNEDFARHWQLWKERETRQSEYGLGAEQRDRAARQEQRAIETHQLQVQEQREKEQARQAFGNLPPFVVKDLEERKGRADVGVQTLESIQNAREAAAAGTLFGFGAEMKLQAYKLAAAAGNKEAARIVAATESFKLNMGPMAQAAIKAYGGAQISNEDRKWGIAMSGGDITQNAETTRRVLDIAERSAKALIGDHRKYLDSTLQGQPPRLRSIFDVREPMAGTPMAGPGGAPAAGGGAVVDVASEAEANKLGRGTRVRFPDGRTGTVQ